LLANGGDELNFLPKFARILYFFPIRLFGTNKYCKTKIVSDFAFQFATLFAAKDYRSRWKNPDRFQHRIPEFGSSQSLRDGAIYINELAFISSFLCYTVQWRPVTLKHEKTNGIVGRVITTSFSAGETEKDPGNKNDERSETYDVI